LSTPRGKKEPAAAELPPGRHPDFDVEGAIHDMPSSFIQCRDFNHSWRPHTAEWNADERCYRVTLKCTRCKSFRNRDIASDGEPLRTNYEYPDGYLIKGMGRITGAERNALRLESIRRVLPENAMAS
jgi:hypothetical protein